MLYSIGNTAQFPKDHTPQVRPDFVPALYFWFYSTLFTQKLNKFPHHIQSYLSSFFFNTILIWGGSQSVLGMGYSSVKFHITFSAKLCRAFWTLDFILNMPKCNMSVKHIFASCGKFTLFAFKVAFNHTYSPSSSSHIDKCIRLHALKVDDKLTKCRKCTPIYNFGSSSIDPPHSILLNRSSSTDPPQSILLNRSSSIDPPQPIPLNRSPSIDPPQPPSHKWQYFSMFETSGGPWPEA